MSIDAFKADARRLGEYLSTKYGWHLSVSAQLEALAVSRGYKDWNTLAAAHAPAHRAIPITGSHQHSPTPPSTAPDSTPSASGSERMLWRALGQGITEILIKASPEGEASGIQFFNQLQQSEHRPLPYPEIKALIAELKQGTQGMAVSGKAPYESGYYVLRQECISLPVQWQSAPNDNGGEQLLVRIRRRSDQPNLSVDLADNWNKAALIRALGNV